MLRWISDNVKAFICSPFSLKEFLKAVNEALFGIRNTNGYLPHIKKNNNNNNKEANM